MTDTDYSSETITLSRRGLQGLARAPVSLDLRSRVLFTALARADQETGVSEYAVDQLVDLVSRGTIHARHDPVARAVAELGAARILWDGSTTRWMAVPNRLLAPRSTTTPTTPSTPAGFHQRHEAREGLTTGRTPQK